MRSTRCSLTATRPVELHEPRFGARERELVLDCIDTNWVSSAGKYVGQFEQMVAAATGARHAIAIVNGTAALHAALLVEGVKPNDEVILPSITFVATANAVSHAGAVPHFVDSTWETLGLDPAALERHLEGIATSRSGETVNRRPGGVIRAIVPVHIFGHPVDMAPLLAVAAKYGLVGRGGCHRIAGFDLAGAGLRHFRPFRGALLQRQQDHHHRRRRHDPDR